MIYGYVILCTRTAQRLRHSAFFSHRDRDRKYPALARRIQVHMSNLSLKIEFGGGLELLFDNKRAHRISLPSRIPSSWSPTTRTSATGSAPSPMEHEETRPTDVRFLIYWLNDNLLRERSELFVEDGTVCVLSPRNAVRA
jgi:hypothetical protein